MNPYKLSVIMCIYNTPEEYLEKAIKSVIEQTEYNIEIILVNDGSNENIREICQKYKEQDKRIKLINQKNQGESVARNVGIQYATTNYITFIDIDDYFENDMCKQVLEYMEKIEYDFDVIIFDCYVDINGKKIKNKFYTKNGRLNKDDIRQIQLQNIEKGISKYYPPETNISVPWAKIYNKDFIIKNNIKFVPKVIRMPDAIFNMEIFEKSEKIYVLDKYLYNYQKNDFSICNRFSKDTVDYYEKYFGYVKKYIEKYNKDNDFKDLLNVKIVTSLDIYMKNYFFNKENPKNNKEKKKEFENLLNKKMYILAMKDVKKQYVDFMIDFLQKYKVERIHDSVILKNRTDAIIQIYEKSGLKTDEAKKLLKIVIDEYEKTAKGILEYEKNMSSKTISKMRFEIYISSYEKALELYEEKD